MAINHIYRLHGELKIADAPDGQVDELEIEEGR